MGRQKEFQERPQTRLTPATRHGVLPGLVVLLLQLAGMADALANETLKAGQEAAKMCNVCHGKNGIATNPEAPNLAGESAIYIEKQLLAFKNGERQHRQMSLIAAQLDKETIKLLAGWYEAMQVTSTLPKLD